MKNRAGTNFNFMRLRLLDFLNKNNARAHRHANSKPHPEASFAAKHPASPAGLCGFCF
jgi:hypothetical protein